MEGKLRYKKEFNHLSAFPAGTMNRALESVSMTFTSCNTQSDKVPTFSEVAGKNTYIRAGSTLSKSNTERGQDWVMATHSWGNTEGNTERGQHWVRATLSWGNIELGQHWAGATLSTGNTEQGQHWAGVGQPHELAGEWKSSAYFLRLQSSLRLFFFFSFFYASFKTLDSGSMENEFKSR